jgi:hypothetical protein
VDHNDVTPDELLYLASEFAGDKPEEYEVRHILVIEKKRTSNLK